VERRGHSCQAWGNAGKSGRRPRFRVNTKQQRTLSYLTEIDAALNAAGEEAGWLHRKLRGMPLSGRSPLAYMIEGGQEAMTDVLRELAGKALRASLATAADASRSAAAKRVGVSRLKSQGATKPCRRLELSARSAAIGDFDIFTSDREPWRSCRSSDDRMMTERLSSPSNGEFRRFQCQTASAVAVATMDEASGDVTAVIERQPSIKRGRVRSDTPVQLEQAIESPRPNTSDLTNLASSLKAMPPKTKKGRADLVAPTRISVRPCLAAKQKNTLSEPRLAMVVRGLETLMLCNAVLIRQSSSFRNYNIAGACGKSTRNCCC
jgi:hypothetical protein